MKHPPEYIRDAMRDICEKMDADNLPDGNYLHVRPAEYGDRWLVAKRDSFFIIGEPLLDGWQLYFFDKGNNVRFNDECDFQFSSPTSFQFASDYIRTLCGVF